MRPEYLEVLNAVRWGWSLWLALGLPAGIIWLSALPWLWSPRRDAMLVMATIALLAFSTAFIAFWFLSVSHSNRIQATKGRLMVTQAEHDDWASDTWNTFAPFTAVPISLVYCTANLLLAHGVCLTAGWLLRRRSAHCPAGLIPDPA